MFKLSKKSRLVGVNPIWFEIIDKGLTITNIDFGIPEHGGLRTAPEQNELFKNGDSRADGYDKQSYHQTGDAIDFYAFIGNKASWRHDHLAMVACALMQAASNLGYSVEWGGLWSSNKLTNGIPYGWDMGHIQLAD